MSIEGVQQFVDEHLPAIMEHFDAQFATVQADQRTIRSAQDAAREQINAVNARLDATNSQLAALKDRVAEVLVQTKATNGSVGELREWRARIEGRLSGVKEGAGGTGHILAATIGTLVGIAGIVIGIISVTS